MNSKVILLIVVFTLAASILAFANPSPQKIRIAAFNLYPTLFQDTDGTVKGFYVDFLNEIAKRENWEIEFVYGSWADGLARIKSGEVDVLTNVAFTSERAQIMDYGKEPLLTVWAELYVPNGSKINGIRDVKNKKIAIMQGDFNAAIFRDRTEKFGIPCEIIEFGNFEEVFNAIATRKADGGVVNNTFGSAKQAEYSIRSSGVIFNPFDIFFTVAKGKNTTILATLDKYLEAWRKTENSPYHQARKRWSHGSASTIRVIHPWLKEVSIISALLLCTAVVFVIVLRIQVRRKTAEIQKYTDELQRKAQLLENEVADRKQAELKILRSKQEWELTFDAAPDLISIIDNEHTILCVNKPAAERHGLSKEELIGRKCYDVMHCSPEPHAACPHGKMLKDGCIHSEQVEEKGLNAHFVVTVSPIFNAEGQLTSCVHIARDVTARIKSDSYRNMGQQILLVLNEERNQEDAIKRITGLVKSTIGVDAVGIRLQNNEDFPYVYQEGFPQDFIETENSLVVRNQNGGVCREDDGNVSLECTCGLVLTGKSDSTNPKWTSGGSYWSNDTSTTPQLPADKDRRTNPRNECIHRGYASVAFIPIRAKGNIVGLLQLNDYRKGVFSLDIIEALEIVAESLGEAMLRRQAEEKLVASERFLRIMTDQLPGMVGYWDTELRCGFANKAYLEWFGKTPEQMLGTTMQELMGKELFSKNEPYIRSVLKGEPQQFERTLVKPTGETGYTWAQYIPDFVHDSMKGFFVLVTDVTALKQAEDAIRESENRLRHALEGTNDGLWDVQMNTGRTYLSLRGCEILGYREDEIEEVGKVWSELVHPEDMALTEERLKAHIDGKAEIFEVEQRLQTKTGGWKWVHTRGKVVERDPVGSPLRITGTHSDITEKKILELQLHQAQKMESIGRLAGGVAHDFNNLLTVILGYAQIGLMRLDPTQPNYDNFEEIVKAAERSAGLTKQLLAFARKQTIAPKVLDLNDAVENMLNMLRRLIGEDINLAWQPATKLWRVKVDPSQLDQILANLCVNARDAISDVGKITIETGVSTFDRAYCAANTEFIPGDYVLLAVSDNGCGMDKETVAQVFEPFFTTKGGDKGTGLGLATVYGIVRQNNGFINVYSEPGHGTTFKIYLPRYEDTPGIKPDEKEASLLCQGQETILLVEDEKSILKMTTILLEKQGYTVLAANTPADAIKLAEKYADEIHLLMTDVVMPDMNGRDLANTIAPYCPNLKILYMSGYTANVIAHHGVLDEGVNFINKPFSVSSLSAKLREVLNKC
jgi:PAS domain S-box-containing protein